MDGWEWMDGQTDPCLCLHQPLSPHSPCGHWVSGVNVVFKTCLMFLFWGGFIKSSGWFSAGVGRIPGCAWCTQAPARGPRGSPTGPWLFLHQNPCSITHLKPPFGASMHHPPIFEDFFQWYLEEHRDPGAAGSGISVGWVRFQCQQSQGLLPWLFPLQGGRGGG